MVAFLFPPTPLPPRPPLRGYLLDGKFFIAGALASTLTKLAVRYLQHVTEPQSRNVSMGVYENGGMGVWENGGMGLGEWLYGCGDVSVSNGNMYIHGICILLRVCELSVMWT